MIVNTNQDLKDPHKYKNYVTPTKKQLVKNPISKLHFGILFAMVITIYLLVLASYSYGCYALATLVSDSATIGSIISFEVVWFFMIFILLAPLWYWLLSLTLEKRYLYFRRQAKWIFKGYIKRKIQTRRFPIYTWYTQYDDLSAWVSNVSKIVDYVYENHLEEYTKHKNQYDQSITEKGDYK